MNMENKPGIRWAIFRFFGPPEVQNLINYIDEIQDAAGASDIVIWPVGEYPLNIQTSAGEDPQDPIMFSTIPQMTAFQQGLSYGVTLMGGSTADMTEQDFKTFQEMNKKSTHSGGSGQIN